MKTSSITKPGKVKIKEYFKHPELSARGKVRGPVRPGILSSLSPWLIYPWWRQVLSLPPALKPAQKEIQLSADCTPEQNDAY